MQKTLHSLGSCTWFHPFYLSISPVCGIDARECFGGPAAPQQGMLGALIVWWPASFWLQWTMAEGTVHTGSPDDVTLQHRLSLAESIRRKIPGMADKILFCADVALFARALSPDAARYKVLHYMSCIHLFMNTKVGLIPLYSETRIYVNICIWLTHNNCGTHIHCKEWRLCVWIWDCYGRWLKQNTIWEGNMVNI